MNKYLTEFVGTFFLVMGVIFGGAIGASVSLMVMIYAGGHISGAHYNPAVTFGLYLSKKVTLDVAIRYIVPIAGYSGYVILG